jgi:hypothetical protein
MKAKRRNWIIAIGAGAVLLAAGLIIAASVLAARIEPLARETAIYFLSQHFNSDVELQTLHLTLPRTSPLRMLLTRGRGISARVEGQGLALRLRGRPGSAPLFVIQKFSYEVSLESLFHPPVIVPQIYVDGMRIQIPPHSANLSPRSPAGPKPGSQQGPSDNKVIIQKVSIHDASLILQPNNPQRSPLRFEIESLQLESVAAGEPMSYTVSLTISKPPGKILARGAFGPWRADEPGDTPLSGDYRFEKADLGVYSGIAGTLWSTGRFEGRLSAITARGQASVPDFRLRMTGNPVPLVARFDVLVDGGNGNTILQPVVATLGATNFTARGGIIRHEPGQRHAITLDVAMPNGNLRDVLRLTMKGSPFMEGTLRLNTKMDIPPLTAKVRDKLRLDGRFEVLGGKFLHSTIQDQLDALSNRARGQAGSPNSDQVVSHMMGVFHMENAAIRFSKLTFGVPGADVDLAGDYNLDSDVLNFAGTLKLQATVSQLVTGWKKLALIPVDPFFKKKGAGTFLRIRIDGTSKEPKLGVNIAGREVEVSPPKK